MNSMAERRSDIRMMCADLVEISWQDRVGSRHTAQAVLEDIAASGACLQVEVPIPLGSVVHWRSQKKAFSGAVRYCVYREIGYFVGLRFDASSTWSRDEYRPQHLLDLAKLMPRTR